MHEAEEALRNGKAFIIIAILTSGVGEVEKYIGQLSERNHSLDYMVFK